MKKKIISCLMVGAMVGSLLIGCGKQPATQASASQESDTSTTKEETEEFQSYDLITNIFGVGVFPLDDQITKNRHLVEDILGMKLNVANNEFTIDKTVSQLESQLATRPDGALLFLMSDTSFEPCVKLCMDSNLVFAFNTNFPTDKALLNQCLDFENFAGGISSDPYSQGVQMAEQAYKEGNKTAVLSMGARGDYNQDQRGYGFTDKFEELGGTVLQEAHSADPSEAVQKTNDLLTAQPDVDCVYGTAGDYLNCSADAKVSRGLDNLMVYGTDIDPSAVERIKDGNIAAANGGVSQTGALAMTLVINALDGHKIVDKDGKAVMLSDLEPIVITSENADQFVKLYDEGSNFVTDDEYKSLLYRYNSDVDLDTYEDYLQGYAEHVYKTLK